MFKTKFNFNFSHPLLTAARLLAIDDDVFHHSAFICIELKSSFRLRWHVAQGNHLISIMMKEIWISLKGKEMNLEMVSARNNVRDWVAYTPLLSSSRWVWAHHSRRRPFSKSSSLSSVLLLPSSKLFCLLCCSIPARPDSGEREYERGKLNI